MLNNSHGPFQMSCDSVKHSASGACNELLGSTRQGFEVRGIRLSKFDTGSSVDAYDETR